MGVGVGVGVGVGLGLGEGLGDGDGLGVGVGDGLGEGVGVGVSVGVGVGVSVGVGVGVMLPYKAWWYWPSVSFCRLWPWLMNVPLSKSAPRTTITSTPPMSKTYSKVPWPLESFFMVLLLTK